MDYEEYDMLKYDVMAKYPQAVARYFPNQVPSIMAPSPRFYWLLYPDATVEGVEIGAGQTEYSAWSDALNRIQCNW